MKTLFTTFQKFAVASLLLIFMAAGSLNAQGILPPDEASDLQDLPLQFNVDTDEVDWEGFTMFPFEGAGLVRIENPDQSGLNPTEMVVEYKKGGGQPWGGFFYHTDGIMEASENAVFRIKVWSPRAGIDALLKLEMRDFAVDTGDMFQTIETANEWVELEWDLSGIAASTPFDRVVFIMDLAGGPGDAGDDWTFYLDDFTFDDGTSVNINDDYEVPASITLEQNYPNPFNPTTNISYTLSENSPVTLEVFNVLGKRVATLVNNDMQTAGSHTVSFDAMNLGSGVYMYRLSTSAQTLTRTMTLIK